VSEPKFKVGEIVVCSMRKKEIVFKILSAEQSNGVWFYQWNRTNFADENMLRKQTPLERGDDVVLGKR
jgi:hypothetical protein